MKGRLPFLGALLFWIWMAPWALAAEATMTHLIFRIADPNIPKEHFILKPKEVWRVGKQYLRLEELPDPQRRIHGLVIADQPDIYIINRYDNRGQHIKDPGPTHEMHLPVFPPDLPKEISGLEFGREREFFKEKNAKSMPRVNVDGKRYHSSRLEIEGVTLILFTGETTGMPAQISAETGKQTYTIQYDTYEVGLKPDMNLFKVPEGVTITEAPQRPPAK